MKDKLRGKREKQIRFSCFRETMNENLSCILKQKRKRGGRYLEINKRGVKRWSAMAPWDPAGTLGPWDRSLYIRQACKGPRGSAMGLLWGWRAATRHSTGAGRGGADRATFAVPGSPDHPRP